MSTDVTIVAHDIGEIGGMERQLTELVGGLLEAGHHVTVIARTCVLPPHERLEFVRVPGPARPFALAYPWFFLAGSLIARRRRRGVLHTTGAIVLNRAELCTVHLCHHAVAERTDLQRVQRSTPAYRLNAWLASRLSRLAERLVYHPRRTDELIAVSRGVRREVDRYFPAMAGRVVVIANGVDTSEFRPADEPKAELRAALGLPAADRLALFVGGEWQRKGLRFAIEALPDAPGWRLAVVGAGDEDRFAAVAQSLDVGERVHFSAPTAEIARWFQAADAFLLPTRYETFSLVTYEAAACGLPLLVTPVSGVEDILRDGENGWFVEPDAEIVADRLRRLGATDDGGAALGRAARKASLDFDWRRMVDAYAERYASFGVSTRQPSPQRERARSGDRVAR